MSRFHIHVSVENLKESIQFYTIMFGQEPSKIKTDYAKWMLDDPTINFAISERKGIKGIEHLGMQADSEEELTLLRQRIQEGNLKTYDEGETVCCYAKSDKTWVKDPTGIAWETYHTMGDTEFYFAGEEQEAGCCAPKKEVE